MPSREARREQVHPNICHGVHVLLHTNRLLHTFLGVLRIEYFDYSTIAETWAPPFKYWFTRQTDQRERTISRVS